MKFRVKKSVAVTLLVLVATMAFLVMFFSIMAEAKSAVPRNGRYTDTQGHIYIMRHGKPMTGYFQYHGKWYYGHKTASKAYPKGSVTQGQFRIRSGNRWYAYGEDGAMIRRDQYIQKGRKRYMTLDIRSSNKTVRYVYSTARTQLGTRYSTRLKRRQEIDENGKWRTCEGMQYIPADWEDWQK